MTNEPERARPSGHGWRSRRWRAGAAAVPLLLTLESGEAAAQASAIEPNLPAFVRSNPYIDPYELRSHVYMGPPPLILFPELLTAPAENQFKRGLARQTPAALTVMENARRPVKTAFGYESAGAIATGAAKAALKNDSAYVLGGVRRDIANAYDSGVGEEIDFGYERSIGQFAAGLTPNKNIDFRVFGLADHIDDDEQPHGPIDALRTDRNIGRVSLTATDVGMWNKLEGYVNAVDYEREADNYTLRDLSGIAVRFDIQYDSYQLGGSGEFTRGRFDNVIGFRAASSELLAERYNVTGGNLLNSYRFPGVKQTNFGVWGETATDIGAADRVKAALRYDYLDADATKARVTPSGGPNAFFNVSPLSLYRTYYGVDSAEVTDHNLSVKGRWTRKLTGESEAYLEAGRLMRSPSEIERWHALSGPTAQRWVGNPHLDSEKHHRIDLGYDLKPAAPRVGGAMPASLRLGAYYDKVTDFVTLDIARGQAGVLTSDGATVARNVDATLAGIDADARWQVTEALSTRVVAAFRYGETDSDDRALYQIPPLEVNWFVDYTGRIDDERQWNAGARLRFSARQSRVDDDSSDGLGMDTGGPAGSFTTLDLYAGIRLHRNLAINLGIDNVFDKHYAEHITGEHIAGVDKPVVAAPGRSVSLRAVATF